MPATLQWGLPVTDAEYNEIDAIERIKSYTNSTDAPTSNYRKFFLHFDRDNADSFDAYSMPFADIIDGKPYANKAALSAANVDSLSDDDKAIANAVIERYSNKKSEGKSFANRVWGKIKSLFCQRCQ